MEAASCSMRPPYLPHGAPQPQGPPLPEHQAGPSGAPRPDDQQQQQQHSKPFFYVQPPPQSYLPLQGLQGLQWPLPLSYSPFYGYPGLGYGMPMMPPHYQPSPYVEPPGFVVPHTHLHLMDYRRLLNPQYYHTMAYHSRRFRYQHSSQSRETATSEVQTEPLVAPQRPGGPSGSEVEAPSAAAVARNGEETPGVPPAMTVQKADRSPELRDLMSPSGGAAPPSSGFVIQTEEVRIECCATPVGLQLLHAREAAEVSRGFSQDVVQCSSVLQRRVLQDEAPSVPADRSEPAPLELVAPEDSAARSEKDPSADDFPLKVVHLPFDAEYLDELRKMESSVWSMEDTLLPAPEPPVHNVSTGTLNQTLTTAAETEMLMFGDEGPTEEVTETSPQEDPLSSVDGLGDETVSEADVDPSLDVSKEAEADLGPSLSPKPDGNHDGREMGSKDHQDTSFESLPAYLPSTSWFTDFDGVHLCRRAPAAPEKRSRPQSTPGLDAPTSRRKLDMGRKDQPSVRKSKPKGRAEHRSLSDHERCLGHSFDENLRGLYVPGKDQLCSRCVAQHDVCPAPDGRSLKRKAAPFQQRNDGPLPTCEACRSHPKRRPARKRSDPEASGSPENSWSGGGPKRRATDPKRPLTSKQNVDGCPAAARLRERNGEHRQAAWDRLRHCPHGNAIRELDENCAVPVPVPLQDQWTNQVSVRHRWQTERAWKAVTPVADVDARSQHFKHKKPQPQSQSHGSRRKDARC